MFWMVQEGPWGIEQIFTCAEDEDISNLANYGIDWDVNDNVTLMTHLLDHNPQDYPVDDPFDPATSPHHLSDVKCEVPGCGTGKVSEH